MTFELVTMSPEPTGFPVLVLYVVQMTHTGSRVGPKTCRKTSLVQRAPGVLANLFIAVFDDGITVVHTLEAWLPVDAK